MISTTRVALAFAIAIGSTGLAVAQSPPPQAGAQPVDIRFVSRQMNVPVEGRFRKVKADVLFDQAKPEASRAAIEIDLNSIELGLEEAEIEVKRPGWFDTAKFPLATFTSSDIKQLSPGNYQMQGKLTIKGITRDVAVPVTVAARTGGGREASGALVVKRLDFKIGDGLWSDTETVADEVQIKFKLALPAQPAS